MYTAFSRDDKMTYENTEDQHDLTSSPYTCILFFLEESLCKHDDFSYRKSRKNVIKVYLSASILSSSFPSFTARTRQEVPKGRITKQINKLGHYTWFVVMCTVIQIWCKLNIVCTICSEIQMQGPKEVHQELLYEAIEAISQLPFNTTTDQSVCEYGSYPGGDT